MFSVFKAGRKTKPVITCRSGTSFATHLRVKANRRLALCGVRSTSDGHITDPDEVEGNLHRQHDGFFYCATCVNLFTGTPKEEVRSLQG